MKKRHSAWWAGMAFLWAMVASTAMGQVLYRVTDVGKLLAGAGSITPTGLNNKGHVVGYYSAIGDAVDRAFFYDGTTARDIGAVTGSVAATRGAKASPDQEYDPGQGVPAGSLPDAARAYAINDADQITGFVRNDQTQYRAFLYSAGVMSILSGADAIRPQSINEAGQIAATYVIGPENHGVLWRNGELLDLGSLGGSGTYPAAINESGMVAGRASVDDNKPPHAFLYNGRQLVDLGLDIELGSSATALNDAGQVVGYVDFTDRIRRHAYLFSGGIATDLGTLGGPLSEARSINNYGVIVGTSWSTPVGGIRAFIYKNGRMQNLQDMADLAAVGAEALDTAIAINDRGQILCTGGGPGSSSVLLLTPITDEVHAPSYLTNVSIRASGGADERSLIGSFVLSGEGCSLLLRGAGPALAAMSVKAAMANPKLNLFNGRGTIVAQNDDWGSSASSVDLASIAKKVGAFPLPEGSKDAAYAGDFAPDAYSFHVVAAEGSGGTALAEIYLNDTSGRSRVVNLSGRAYVGTGDDVMIAGFVIGGDSPRQLLVRAVGPALARQGVAQPLANPRFTVYDANGVPVAANAGWGTAPNAVSIAAASTKVGAFALPADSQDSAVLTLFQPGAYTVVVYGGNSATGVALVELYDAE